MEDQRTEERKNFMKRKLIILLFNSISYYFIL